MSKKQFNVTSGTELRCKNWRAEGLLRLMENVLAVGEDPDNLVVYAALGKAARDWPSHDKIVESLHKIEEDETLVVQSGKPIGILKTHKQAPVVIMANCNMVGQWAKAENFYEWEKQNLICWGGLTAGDWQYIGSQGVIQGTYEIFMRIAEQSFNNDLAGRLILTAGLGGMGGAQPLAGRMAGAVTLCVEIDQERIQKRKDIGFLDVIAKDLDDALAQVKAAMAEKRAVSIGVHGNAADLYEQILARNIIPDIVTDQTSAHDLVYGYVPATRSLDEARAMRKSDPQTLMNESRASIVRHVTAMLGFQKAGSVVFDNGNLIRTHAKDGGVADAFNIPVFTEAFLRPLFCRAIGPFRWIALSNNQEDIRIIDNYILKAFAGNHIVTNWIHLAGKNVPFEGLPARIAWLGHGERTQLALAVNSMVRDGTLSGPVAFTRDHLDAGAMAHPNIMTENMRDGSDAIADWPLINGLAMCSSQADLVAIHSGGGGYSGYMTSAGVTVVADGTDDADIRIELSLTNDTSLGVMRYADAGYEEALDEAEKKNIRHFNLA
ncbi:urocanate hydratase [Pseudochrobactrum algeriensis]|uniref:urocanate hydratase n=1 Tax=Pseudochrobactrum algeriensis TaxID=2834768 RepID=UPI001BCB5691|nr:urocanate hydratase [Pseudochrobactrum algeriensis]MBX8811494.1 urocanate hydratase [Ochrobactrum sp. MR34]QVQ37931.1 urocanate hydratase [Pseudochrobactrum algeriensis]QVQ41153.1 urocanate hydratase [Pseudochrobactrum algeriensis]QVQ45077.1 urocanate hydratase [Pseudochrobactrum algeriensis]